MKSCILSKFMKFFFDHLYHDFAWGYDLVANIVSLGMWKDWIRSCLPFIEGPQVLELGHGPGHLQKSLFTKGLFTIGLDESHQMGMLASRRIRNRYLNNDQPLQYPSGYANIPRLIRAHAQHIPLPSESFNTVVATFPTEYIFSSSTLGEVRRVLVPDGRLIIIFSAWFSKMNLARRFSAWIFRITGQTINWENNLAAQFQKENFHISLQKVQVKSSTVLIIIAQQDRKPII